ncbi:hypothetical protein CVT26_004615 [Gymnopilus dilepis]|uniref:Uncharacterized protein n=1 Tax=Gymnopilus dilepis TaxID=231916 RepID=A0A409YJC5_9AGAR|nr:hypothetical protein CVT26_004615 [Gymnopilus dilepis]
MEGGVSQGSASQSVPRGTPASGTEVVLHRSRRRRASQELTPESDGTPSSPATGIWRPVRLQGYSEDPMKDEIIRGQTQTIKLLQAQLQAVQLAQGNQEAKVQNNRDGEEALHELRSKQQKLIEHLQGSNRDSQMNTHQHEVASETRRLVTPQGPVNNVDPARCTWSDQGVGMSNVILSSPSATANESLPLSQHSELIQIEESNMFADEVENVEPLRSSVPLPLSFKKSGSRRRQPRFNQRVPPPVNPTIPPVWSSASSSHSVPSEPHTNVRSQSRIIYYCQPLCEQSVISLEAKIDLIMSKLGLSDANLQQQGDRQPRTRDFKSPRSRTANLLGIQQDRDILIARDTLYAQNTPLKSRMAQFEENAGDLGPNTLTPMEVNWEVIHGRWNERLFKLFLGHCQENGYGEGTLTADDEDEISDLFFKRLERIQGIINEYRPKPNETIQQADSRYSNRHLQKLSVARRNRRRGELFNVRCDINLDHLPEDLTRADGMHEDAKRWIDRHKINEALGIEGTSSDETDPYDSDAYYVHRLKWRNRDMARKMRSTDAARRTTNEYGNNRPGNKPRTRKRQMGDHSKESCRKVPAGLPVNCYDEGWYNGLSPQKQRALRAKPALELMASWDSD